MPTLSSMRLPPPKDGKEFEEICLISFKSLLDNKNLEINGRSGQKQCGIDIIIYNQDNTKSGVQCKNTNSLDINKIKCEIEKAEEIKPPIVKLYIATTLNRDNSLQEKVRSLSENRKNNNQFELEIIFWEDIINELAKDKNELNKHYPFLQQNQTQDSSDDSEVLKHLLDGFKMSAMIYYIQCAPKFFHEDFSQCLNRTSSIINGGKLKIKNPTLENKLKKWIHEWKKLAELFEGSKEQHYKHLPSGHWSFYMPGDYTDEPIYEELEEQLKIFKESLCEFAEYVDHNFTGNILNLPPEYYYQ